MGTEVLRPQDVFYDRFRLSPPVFHHRRRTYSANGNGFGNPRSNNNSGHRKPVHRDHKRKTSPQSPPPQKSDQQPQLQIPRRSPSASPPPQPQKSSEQQRRSSSAPPPPQPVVEQQQQQQLGLNNLLLPRRSASVDELQNDLPRVTILRRGQSLDTIDASRLKRDLENETRGGGGLMRDDVYAGSAFFVSPSPSSLPLPSFFNININNNNSNSNNNGVNISNHSTVMSNEEFHDSATRDLRRLLRLE